MSEILNFIFGCVFVITGVFFLYIGFKNYLIDYAGYFYCHMHKNFECYFIMAIPYILAILLFSVGIPMVIESLRNKTPL